MNGDKGKQQLEPAVVQNGFVTRSSGHSSGSESRSMGGQSSMQSIPEGKPDLAHSPSSQRICQIRMRITACRNLLDLS